MVHLIDKDALVAEIEKRKGMCDNHYGDYWNGCYNTFTDILSFLNTLEVKEVDLEKEFERLLDEAEGVPRMWHSDEQIEWGKDIAKHFFELGLKAQKG